MPGRSCRLISRVALTASASWRKAIPSAAPPIKFLVLIVGTIRSRALTFRVHNKHKAYCVPCACDYTVSAPPGRGRRGIEPRRRSTTTSKPRACSTPSWLPANKVLQEGDIGHLLKHPDGLPPKDVRRYHANFSYQVGTWDKPRRVVAKIESGIRASCTRASGSS